MQTNKYNKPYYFFLLITALISILNNCFSLIRKRNKEIKEFIFSLVFYLLAKKWWSKSLMEWIIAYLNTLGINNQEVKITVMVPVFHYILRGTLKTPCNDISTRRRSLTAISRVFPILQPFCFEVSLFFWEFVLLVGRGSEDIKRGRAISLLSYSVRDPVTSLTYKRDVRYIWRRNENREQGF